MFERKTSIKSKIGFIVGGPTNLNLYVVSIFNLVATTFVLLDESWRIVFLREIGNQLDDLRDQAARRRWDDLLKEFHNR